MSKLILVEQAKDLMEKWEDEDVYQYEDIACPLAVEAFIEWLYLNGWKITNE